MITGVFVLQGNDAAALPPPRGGGDEMAMAMIMTLTLPRNIVPDT